MKLKSIEDVDGPLTTGFYWKNGLGFILKTYDQTIDVLYSDTESKHRNTHHRFLAIQWHDSNWKHFSKKFGFMGKNHTYYDGHYVYVFYILKLNFSFGFTWYSTPVIS